MEELDFNEEAGLNISFSKTPSINERDSGDLKKRDASRPPRFRDIEIRLEELRLKRSLLEVYDN